MKSTNRITYLFVPVLVSLVFITSLFTLFTSDVEALNTLSVNVSGPITTDTTWTAANSPYILNGEITVNEGVTLTIEPGVVIMGQTNSLLAIDGRLEAIGTVSEPITFTSILSSTPGEWYGLVIGLEDDTGSAHLNHVTVQYGVSNIFVDSIDGAPLTKIENTTTQYSQEYGMVIGSWSLHLVELDNVAFANNGKDRIQVETVENPPLTGNPTLTAQPGLEGYEVGEYYSDSFDFDIPAGVTLTVEPGVTLFTSQAFGVYGHLEAIGTPTQPITFTSIANSAPGEWYGIHIGVENDTGSAYLNHVVVQYATHNINIHPLDGAPITRIENTTTQFSQEYGMVIGSWSLHLVELDNVAFANNGKDRIQVETVENPPLTGNPTLTAQPGLEGYEVGEYYSDSFDFDIPAGVTLTIDPGVTVMAQEDVGLFIRGHLDAVGTPSNPITFTSVLSSTPGEWWGVHIVENGSAHIDYATVQYASYNLNIHLFETAPTSRIENTTIEFAANFGMQVSGHSLHLFELDNVTFSNNAKNRIEVYAVNDNTSLKGNTTLTAQPGLEGYEIYSSEGDFQISSDITLTLKPDVTLFIPEASNIQVNGRLEAIGTLTRPITITSISNSFTEPWGGLFVQEASSLHLNNAVIQYSYYNIGFYLHNSDRTSVIENTHIQYGGNVGMQIASHALHLVELDNVTFKENGKNRIEIGVLYPSASLIGNATLTQQPGLEGYEFYPYSPGPLTFSIPANITLTVKSDVSLFMEKGDFVVNGRLEAIGTPAQPITFTSIATDTYPWQGISVDGGEIELKHANIQRSNGSGLSISNGTVAAHCSTFTDNLGSGISIDVAAQGDIQLAYNSLVSNTVAGLRNESPVWLDARYTWWGAADGPSGSGSGSGDAVNGNVYVTPWLTAPECQDDLPQWQIFLPAINNSE